MHLKALNPHSQRKFFVKQSSLLPASTCGGPRAQTLFSNLSTHVCLAPPILSPPLCSPPYSRPSHPYPYPHLVPHLVRLCVLDALAPSLLGSLLIGMAYDLSGSHSTLLYQALHDLAGHAFSKPLSPSKAASTPVPGAPPVDNMAARRNSTFSETFAAQVRSGAPAQPLATTRAPSFPPASPSVHCVPPPDATACHCFQAQQCHAFFPEQRALVERLLAPAYSYVRSSKVGHLAAPAVSLAFCRLLSAWLPSSDPRLRVCGSHRLRISSISTSRPFGSSRRRKI